MKTCIVEDCEGRTLCRGYCSVHYERVKAHGDPSIGDRSNHIINADRICTVDGCSDQVRARDLCGKHYARQTRYGDVDFVKNVVTRPYISNVDLNRKCSVEGCQDKYRTKGYCNKHYKKLLKYGDPLHSVLEWHHMRGTPEHYSWVGMIARCTDTNHASYENYGGRGISVCERWRNSFTAFYEDMGPKPTESHTIERKDNDGNYEPGNCKWATLQEQSRDKRINKNNKSGYTGVRLHAENGAWVAYIYVGRHINLGSFKSKMDAVRARKEAELKYWGKT